ncbi:MAG: hypothetical protein AAFY08_14460 [Planctomycetota bacterium]
MPEERKVTKVEVFPSAMERIDDYCRRRDRTKYIVLSDLIEWFAGLDEGVQDMIVGRTPASIELDVAEMVVGQIKARRARGVHATPASEPTEKS